MSIEAQKQYEKVMKTDGSKPVRIEEKPKSAYIKRKEKEKLKRFKKKRKKNSRHWGGGVSVERFFPRR